MVRQAKLGRTNRMKGICTAKKTTCRSRMGGREEGADLTGKNAYNMRVAIKERE